MRRWILPLCLLGACAGDDSGDSGKSGGIVDGCPVAETDPDAVSWVNLVAGEPTKAKLKVRNSCSGLTALTVEATPDAAAFTVDPDTATIDPGDSFTFTLTATWSEQPGTEAHLDLVVNDPSTAKISVHLQATLDPDQDHDGTAYDTDCDDSDPTAYPGAAEVPGDGVDQDCDGIKD